MTRYCLCNRTKSIIFQRLLLPFCVASRNCNPMTALYGLLIIMCLTYVIPHPFSRVRTHSDTANEAVCITEPSLHCSIAVHW